MGFGGFTTVWVFAPKIRVRHVVFLSFCLLSVFLSSQISCLFVFLSFCLFNFFFNFFGKIIDKIDIFFIRSHGLKRRLAVLPAQVEVKTVFEM